jgi:hypothetical protein
VTQFDRRECDTGHETVRWFGDTTCWFCGRDVSERTWQLVPENGTHNYRVAPEPNTHTMAGPVIVVDDDDDTTLPIAFA